MVFDDEVVLNSINLYINDKEFLTLLGPSGCGKTTTLRIIGGFQKPTSGDVFFDGVRINDVPPHRRQVNTVFQKYALFTHMNLFENVAFGLRIAKVPEKEIERRVNEALELVNLPGYGKRSVDSLSGGQQQRIAIARAIVNRPQVLLLDEPLGALDLKLRKDMQIELKKIQQQVGITFVYVTHDQEEAMAVSDRIAVMNAGVIQHIGTPKNIYQRPANLFVSTFIGRSNVMNGKLKMEDGKPVLHTTSGYTVALHNVEPEQQKDQDIILSVRPEEFLLNRDANAPGIAATVDDCVFLGLMTHYFVHLESGEEVEIIQESSIDSIIEPGTKIRLTLNTEKVNAFTADGSRNIMTGVRNDCVG